MEPITPKRMKEVEDRAENLGISRIILMENAGHATAEFIKAKFRKLKDKKLVVVAGTGNNGGDGFVVARHLSPCVKKVDVIVLGKINEIKTYEASANIKVLLNMELTINIHEVPNLECLLPLKNLINSADIVIDAIFGTGIKGSIKEPHSTAIDLINSSKAYKVAIDIPSGLDPLTGEIHDKVVKVNATVTFHKMKKGLIGREDVTGEIVVAPIGIPPEVDLYEC
jgi:NAD(P)H-hydrate epimerase